MKVLINEVVLRSKRLCRRGIICVCIFSLLCNSCFRVATLPEVEQSKRKFESIRNDKNKLQQCTTVLSFEKFDPELMYEAAECRISNRAASFFDRNAAIELYSQSAQCGYPGSVVALHKLGRDIPQTSVDEEPGQLLLFPVANDRLRQCGYQAKATPVMWTIVAPVGICAGVAVVAVALPLAMVIGLTDMVFFGGSGRIM